MRHYRRSSRASVSGTCGLGEPHGASEEAVEAAEELVVLERLEHLQGELVGPWPELFAAELLQESAAKL